MLNKNKHIYVLLRWSMFQKEKKIDALYTKVSKSMRAEVVLFLPHTPRTVQPVPLAVS